MDMRFWGIYSNVMVTPNCVYPAPVKIRSIGHIAKTKPASRRKTMSKPSLANGVRREDRNPEFSDLPLLHLNPGR